MTKRKGACRCCARVSKNTEWHKACERNLANGWRQASSSYCSRVAARAIFRRRTPETSHQRNSARLYFDAFHDGDYEELKMAVTRRFLDDIGESNWKGNLRDNLAKYRTTRFAWTASNSIMIQPSQEFDLGINTATKLFG